MTCKINADTTNGLKLTSDTSGEIDLQTNGTTKVHMDSSGNVGIGTTSPSHALDIQGSSPTVRILENTAGTLTSSLKLHGNRTGTGGAVTSLEFINTQGASVGTETSVNSIQSWYESAGNQNMKFILSGSERMRITSSGDVGIGTLSPSQKLDVNGTINATAFTGDGSSLTGISTPITKSEVIYHSTSTVSSGNTQITLFQEFKYPSNGKISGTFNKQSASTTMVVYFHYCARATSGNPHTFAMWCDAGNNTSLFRATHFDPYHMSQSQVNATWCARWTGLSAGNHTFNCAMGRGDTSNVAYVVNFNENSYDGLGINTNGYSMIYAMEIE
jgi:hypothetical protein